MSLRGTTTILVGTLLAVPTVGSASPTVTSYASARTISSESAGAAEPTHATKGIVKLIDDHTLVITRSPQRSHELSFVLDRSTLRSGEITVGSMVEVRYRTQGGKRVATAVRGEHHVQRPSEVDNE